MKKRQFYFFGGLAIILFGVMCLSFVSGSKKPPKAKYVFLFIGDGMGLNQVFLTNEYLKQTHQQPLVIPALPYFALTTTNCIDSSKITDSAAGGTAIATGHKTYNGAIGINPLTNDTFSSVATILKKRNWKIGILSSVGLNHATPASFYGHQASRRTYDDLVSDMQISNFDYFAGGGIMTSKKINKEKARDSLFSQIKDAGYHIISDPATSDSLLKVYKGKKVFLYNKKKLYEDESFFYTIDKPEEMKTLADYVKKGINFLQNETGFFMMAEGGNIDWACHQNDAAAAIQEVIAFNEAVKAGLDFYNKHKDETLIIITADHETGGLSFGCNATAYNKYCSKLESQKISAQALIDSLKNIKLENYYSFIKNNIGLKPDYLFYQKENPDSLASYIIKSIDQEAGVCWTTGHHTGMPVGTYAIGVGADYFTGIIDNTQIIKAIQRVTGN